ncbi:MAG: hypothetical protein AAB974_00565 [Patescibacteria group bacterium]
MQHIKRIATGIVPFVMFTLPMVAFAATDITGINAPGLSGALGLGTADIRVTIASIINVFMGLLGIIAVVIILYGGFMWMTAAGNEERVDKARKMIVSGIIGLAIILSAYAIARFVVGSLVNATA